MSQFTALLVALFIAIAGNVGISWSQETLPPRTLTKKRIVVQNIHHCEPGRSTLVGRGSWDPITEKHSKYVCRPRSPFPDHPHN